VSYTRSVIVIPTRNRAAQARNAINSILGQSDCEVNVLVSDNSTSTEQRTELSQHCQQAANGRLRYIVPPEPLPMSQHWDWAMRQALSLYDASHVAFLTDRMMFKPDVLKHLLAIVADYPGRILTYMHDMVDDYQVPVIVRQYTWTGNLYEVPTRRLLELVAQSVMYDTAVPRMLNCLVPRRVLEAIRDRFGSFFASLSPDWNFAFRALECEDSILFYDEGAMVHYAQDLSNGQSAHYGIENQALTTFLQDIAGQPINNGTPFPEIATIWNGIISEYCLVKEITKSPKFPELNLEEYMRVLAWGIEQMKNPERRQRMREFLSARGWKYEEAGREQKDSDGTATREELPAKSARQVEEFSVNAIEFQSKSAALNYALRSSRKRSAATNHQELLHGVILKWTQTEADEE